MSSPPKMVFKCKPHPDWTWPDRSIFLSRSDNSVMLWSKTSLAPCQRVTQKKPPANQQLRRIRRLSVYSTLVVLHIGSHSHYHNGTHRPYSPDIHTAAMLLLRDVRGGKCGGSSLPIALIIVNICSKKQHLRFNIVQITCRISLLGLQTHDYRTLIVFSPRSFSRFEMN